MAKVEQIILYLSLDQQKNSLSIMYLLPETFLHYRPVSGPFMSFQAVNAVKQP